MPPITRLNPIVALALLSLTCLATARAAAFEFEGFALGMPHAQASTLRPDVAWQPDASGAAGSMARKEFTASYLGREAQVSIGLDPEGKFVRLIAFAFRPESGSQCILDAVGARLQLEKRIGPAMESSNEAFGRRMKWIDADGATVRWLEACAVDAGGYFVTYAKPAD
ncbi:hypothetical protein OPU71_02830 [Niveibacterium sp. 24ML]|uniref:hypothetical protein n=1 Tax=Niveibacterium sp. 24ML TaxID=2985512 RepID=UPI0022702FC4|nr:hypothetical protein [Niveibacterium sp. 24ML]MCX9155057.1 hypothetical protein [Niveibacterium sp. 24ML]